MKNTLRTLLVAATLLAAACSRRPVEPIFGEVVIDTLIGSRDQPCSIDFRFATILNADSSPALLSIEQANINRFFELEEFSGSAAEAVAEALRQLNDELMPAPVTSAAWQISVEAEAEVVDTLMCYIITRSSYTGGAHGAYDMECYTYSLVSGDAVTLDMLLSQEQMARIDEAIRQKIYQQYGVATDEALMGLGFFPEYIRYTDNFRVTADGIVFYYNPYEIGCYALGAVEVVFSREELAALGNR